MRRTQKQSKIPVLFLKENDKIIAYSPVLDISTCGNTETQAKKRFSELVSIFFYELVKMGTLEEVLTECGWKKLPSKQTWIPPVIKHSEESIAIPV